MYYKVTGKSNYKYVLDIIDHFTKFSQSYLLNTKETLEVFCKIREFIEFYGIPKYLISDNGSEFKNKKLKNYSIKKILNFSMVFLIDQHSQGLVERLHRVIKRSLYCKKEEMKNNYNVDFAISEIIKIKNNTYSRIIGSTPNELFFRSFSEEEIKNINLKMLESQKLNNIFRNKYEINEKVLINDNFKIENNTLKKRNKKYGSWVITGIILKSYSFNSYKNKITKDYQNILFKDDIYYCLN